MYYVLTLRTGGNKKPPGGSEAAGSEVLHSVNNNFTERDMEDEMKLRVEINNKRPVELIDLAQSMLSLSDEYRRFAPSENDDVKLYVKEIRSGSIIQELVAMSPYALPFIEHSKTVLEYAKHLKVLIDFLSGQGEQKPAAIVEKTTLTNIASIVEPVAKDNGSQMIIHTLNVSGDAVFNFGLNSLEANATQNAVRRIISQMKEPVTGVHEQVVMYWAQARNATDGKAGDKARIESLSKLDVKVRFASDALKKRMLYDEPFPFGKAYVVDVAVETVEDKPVLYRILDVHDTLER